MLIQAEEDSAHKCSGFSASMEGHQKSTFERMGFAPPRTFPRANQVSPPASCLTAPRPALRAIGAVGFEPTTASSQSWYSTKLSYAPFVLAICPYSYILQSFPNPL